MTTFYITTGISASQHSRCWELAPDKSDPDAGWLDGFRGMKTLDKVYEEDDGWTYLQKITELRNQIFAGIAAEVNMDHPSVAEAMKSFWPGSWSPDYRHLLPAEAATVHQLVRGENVVNAGDVLHFLGSPGNQKEAAVSAAIVKNSLEDFDVKLTITKADWEPRQHCGFIAAMKEVDEVISEGSDSRFVLTGGYKAIQIHLAMKLRYERNDTEIYYLNEIGQEVIRFPIREPHDELPVGR